MVSLNSTFSLFLLFAQIFPCLTVSYNILIMNLIPFQSHLMTSSVLANELVTRGHQVVYISLKVTNPHPNLKWIQNEDVFQLPPDFANIVGNFSAFEFGKFMMDRAAGTSDKLLETPLFQKLIHLGTQESVLHTSKFSQLNNIYFDLVIAESHFMQEIYAAAFAEKFNCPLITYQPILTPPHVAHLLGNYYNPAFMADYKLGYTGRMNFWQRLENSCVSALQILYQNFIYLPKIDDLMRKHFGKVGAKDWPYIKEIFRNRNALTLVDTHHLITDPKANNPNVMEIGGIHINPEKPLPKDIELFINSSAHGLIYFAMGTFVDGKNLSPRKKDALLKLFSQLEEKIIWKMDPKHFHDPLPENVKIGKWFPQNDILAHPKCKLFITHGGIHSVLESLYHGVPLVSIPVFADQSQNSLALKEKGIGEKVSFDFTYEEISRQVFKVLTDPKYKENMKTFSPIYRSEVVSIKNRTMFYIEHVVRHNGAHYLRSQSIQLTWYQYLNLDIFLFFMLILVLTFYGVYLIVKRFTQIIMRNIYTTINKRKKDQ